MDAHSEHGLHGESVTTCAARVEMATPDVAVIEAKSRARYLGTSLAPARLVQAKLSTKRGELWLPRDVVVRLPAVR
jgi:hypothetical protein